MRYLDLWADLSPAIAVAAPPSLEAMRPRSSSEGMIVGPTELGVQKEELKVAATDSL